MVSGARVRCIAYCRRHEHILEEVHRLGQAMEGWHLLSGCEVSCPKLLSDEGVCEGFQDW